MIQNAQKQMAEKVAREGPTVGTVTHGRLGQSAPIPVADPTPGESQTDIFTAAADGNVAQTLQLVDAGQDVNGKDAEGRSFLHWACDGGHRELVQALLERGADTDACDGDGQTALHYATMCDFPEIALDLVQAGARLDIEDQDGETALQACGGELKASLQAAAAGR
jgi:ankyrin repeat protein